MRKQVYEKRRTRLRSALIFGTVCALLLGMLFRLDRAIRPELCAVCQSETERFVAGQMANSMASVLEREQPQYREFVTLTYDADGNVTAVETDTEQMNRLQAAIYAGVQEDLEQCRNACLEVSLGTATGIWLFAERGPHVSVRLLPIGYAAVKLVSSLESAGINQTRHTIYAKVTARVRAAIPFSETVAETTYDCLLAETVIVGSVPESYLEFDGEIAR